MFVTLLVLGPDFFSEFLIGILPELLNPIVFSKVAFADPGSNSVNAFMPSSYVT